jgi:hypothetical protein
MFANGEVGCISRSLLLDLDEFRCFTLAVCHSWSHGHTCLSLRGGVCPITDLFDILYRQSFSSPITVAARSKAWTVFSRSNAGIMSSNPTRGMDVCMRLFCLCCFVCR